MLKLEDITQIKLRNSERYTLYQKIDPLIVELRPCQTFFFDINGDNHVARCNIRKEDVRGFMNLDKIISSSLKLKSEQVCSLKLEDSCYWIKVKIGPNFTATTKDKTFTWDMLKDRFCDAFVVIRISDITNYDNLWYPQINMELCYLKTPPWTKLETKINESFFLRTYIETPDPKDEQLWILYNKVNY